jgi:hypothetical protein
MSASRTKSPATRKNKQASDAPLAGRYSRSEGAGPGPQRKAHSPAPKRRKGSSK